MRRERPVWEGNVRAEGKPAPRRTGQRFQAEGTHLMQSPECGQCQNKKKIIIWIEEKALEMPKWLRKGCGKS